MIRIEKSKDGWIVYETRAFARYHTHCKYFRVAKKIRRAVITQTVPQTDSIELLISCKRLTRDSKYIKKLDERIRQLNDNQEKHNNNDGSVDGSLSEHSFSKSSS